MLDVLSLIIGFVVGIIAVSIAIELGWKKQSPTKTYKMATRWSLNELHRPRVVAEKLKMDVPRHADVVVKARTSFSKNALENPDVTGNFAVGDGKALIFAGEIHPDQMAFRTVDDDIVRRLREQFQQYTTEPSETTGKAPMRGGITMRGMAKAVVPYRDQYLIRLSTTEGIRGVLINERLDLEGKTIEVEGELVGGDRPFIKPYHLEIIE